jgi:hypothetical protein
MNNPVYQNTLNIMFTEPFILYYIYDLYDSKLRQPQRKISAFEINASDSQRQ